MKQSSIEWLFEQVWINPVSKLPEILEQAKAIHKKEIMDAHGETQDELEDDGSWRRQTAEQYYNETFNTKEK